MQQGTPAGPLATPKALRRSTGAHNILVELGLSDLAGLLLALALGALFGALLVPPIGWFFQFYGGVLHASLPLDITTLVIALVLANGILRKWVLHKDASASWGCAAALALVAGVASVILYFAKRSWIAIPSPIFPPVAQTPLSWSPPPSALGLLVAAFLLVNEMPEHVTDPRGGKRTVPARIGLEKSVTLYEILVGSALVLLAVLAASRLISWVAGIGLIALIPLARARSVLRVHYQEYPAHIPANAGTIQAVLLLGIAMTLAYLISAVGNL